MKWNDHVDKIVNKASKTIYLLKQLKRFGLNAGGLKCFYVASIRSILEHSCQVFHYGLQEYLSEVIERIPRRALHIVYPQLSYQVALDALGLQTLYSRRRDLCNELFESALRDKEHKLQKPLPPKATSNTYNFRNDKLFNMSKYPTRTIGLETHL